MPEFTIGNYLATRHEKIGIKHYFMVPGDYNLVLPDQLLANKNMEQIGCCNELKRVRFRRGGRSASRRSSPGVASRSAQAL
jgi:hypothetical protein